MTTAPGPRLLRSHQQIEQSGARRGHQSWREPYERLPHGPGSHSSAATQNPRPAKISRSFMKSITITLSPPVPLPRIDMEAIRHRLATGLSPTQVARELGVSRGTVYKAKVGMTDGA